PPLRERGEDVVLLFRKFTSDFSEKYHVRPISLDIEAQAALVRYSFPGNIRQLKNIAEQISLLESEREVDAPTLAKYLPSDTSRLPMTLPSLSKNSDSSDLSERDLLYKVLFDMKKDMNELKKLVLETYQNGGLNSNIIQKHQGLFEDMDSAFSSKEHTESNSNYVPLVIDSQKSSASNDEDYEEDVIEDIIHEEDDNSLSLEKKEKEMIIRALRKHNNKRKYAANDLGISERTLYRKIKQYEIDQ